MKNASRSDRGGGLVLPRVQERQRIFVVGDIHGRADLLASLLKQIDRKIEATYKDCLVIFLGDYIDRGPASRQVIDMLIDFSKSRNVVCLKGNHEALLLGFVSDRDRQDVWLANGGLDTMRSYGIVTGASDPRSYRSERFGEKLRDALGDHLAWLAQLPLSHSLDSFFFVHAGVRPTIPFRRQSARDLLFIKEMFLSWRDPFENYVIHGHTPVPTVEIFHNRANVDTGAYATNKLSCLELDVSHWSVFST